jgi:hypothetical protein
MKWVRGVGNGDNVTPRLTDAALSFTPKIFLNVHKLLIFLAYLEKQKKLLKCLLPLIIWGSIKEVLVSLASFVLMMRQRCEARPIGVKAGKELIQLGIIKSDQGPARRKSQLKTRRRALPGRAASNVHSGNSLTSSSELCLIRFCIKFRHQSILVSFDAKIGREKLLLIFKNNIIGLFKKC